MACAHDKPFEQDTFGSDTTLTRGSDRQLTYNLGTDKTPGWSPDGSRLLYMFEDVGRTDRDRCLGAIPSTGGTVRNIICPVTLPSLDSLDALYEPAPGPDGRLLFVREASTPQSLTPVVAALMLASETDPLDATVVRAYPYTAPNGKIHGGISNVRWLSATRAVYLAENVVYVAPCPSCPPDTLRTGIELVEVDLSGASPTIQIIPNTDEASSVAAGAGVDQIYFTKNGDSRVYEMALSTGAIAIIHDFGAGGIVRDVSVAGNTMVAVVGGRVDYFFDPVLGSVQKDVAGALRTVDLTSGNETVRIVAGRLFRRSSISPNADRLVAEGFPATIVDCGPGCSDTTIVKVADLWLVEIP